MSPPKDTRQSLYIADSASYTNSILQNGQTAHGRAYASPSGMRVKLTLPPLWLYGFSVFHGEPACQCRFQSRVYRNTRLSPRRWPVKAHAKSRSCPFPYESVKFGSFGLDTALVWGYTCLDELLAELVKVQAIPLFSVPARSELAGTLLFQRGIAPTFYQMGWKK